MKTTRGFFPRVVFAQDKKNESEHPIGDSFRVGFVSEVQSYELMLVLPFIVFTLTILFDFSYVWHALGITTRQALAAQSLTLLSIMMVPPWPNAIWALALTPLTFLAPRAALTYPLKRGISTMLESPMAIVITFLLESKLDSAYPYERLLGVDFSLWLSLGWAFATQMLVRK